MGANVKLAGSMQAATKTMADMNNLMKPQDVAQNMRNFEKAAAQLNMSEEVGEFSLQIQCTRHWFCVIYSFNVN